MSKIYVSIDLEGISGFVHWDQSCAAGGRQNEVRMLMAAEANAAIAGAFDGGATEVLVNDAHAAQRNISPVELDRRARLITGSTKPLSMMQGIDESFDGAFLVGYHAGAGTRGVLSHTYSSTCVTGVRLNGQLAGEVALNAAVAGYYGVPVALVTGDTGACRDALSTLGAIETVAVKEAISRYSANCLNPEVAREQIRTAARTAVGRLAEFEPFTLEPPVQLEIGFTHSGCADCAGVMPGVERMDAVTVRYESEDLITAYRGFLTMLALAGRAG